LARGRSARVCCDTATWRRRCSEGALNSCQDGPRYSGVKIGIIELSLTPARRCDLSNGPLDSLIHTLRIFDRQKSIDHSIRHTVVDPAAYQFRHKRTTYTLISTTPQDAVGRWLATALCTTLFGLQIWLISFNDCGDHAESDKSDTWSASRPASYRFNLESGPVPRVQRVALDNIEKSLFYCTLVIK
jgi:hypothetical protein